MVENRRFGDLFAYLVLGVGVLVVAFPVYLAILASTFENSTIANGNMPLIPGNQAVENYSQTLLRGTMRTSREPVGLMMVNSFIMALGIATGKILISILSAF